MGPLCRLCEGVKRTSVAVGVFSQVEVGRWGFLLGAVALACLSQLSLAENTIGVVAMSDKLTPSRKNCVVLIRVEITTPLALTCNANTAIKDERYCNRTIAKAHWTVSMGR